MQRFLVFLSAVFLALPAHAVIIASGDGTGNPQPPVDDPGFANVGTIGNLSAVYLGNRWVLTANHVGAGEAFFEGTPYAALLETVRWLVNPDYPVPDYPVPDLVLFQIAEDPGLPTLSIAETTPEVGASLVMIGHGRNRGEPVLGADGILGWWWGEGHATRWGTNELHDGGFEVATEGGRTSVFITDFSEDGTEFEAHAANGDSGGAVYSGDHELAGVMLAVGPFFRPANPALFSNLTYIADLARYREQILAIVGVPELRLPTDAYDFGGVPLDESRNLRIAVTNAGTSDLTLDEIALAGGSDPDFQLAVPEALPVILPPVGEEPEAGRLDLEITYTPSHLGPATGLLSIESDDPEEPNAQVALSGAGLYAAPACIVLRRLELRRDRDEQDHDELKLVDLAMTLAGGRSYDAARDRVSLRVNGVLLFDGLSHSKAELRLKGNNRWGFERKATDFSFFEGATEEAIVELTINETAGSLILPLEVKQDDENELELRFASNAKCD
jgi:hypothetical protein